MGMTRTQITRRGLSAASLLTLLAAGLTSAAGVEPKAPSGAIRPDKSGTITAIARDGKSITLQIPAAMSGKPTAFTVQVTKKTSTVFFGVGPGEAKLTVGYVAEAFLVEDTKNTAARLRIIKDQDGPATGPEILGKVSAPTKDGTGFTLQPRKTPKGPDKVKVQITDRTQVSYFGVPKNGARPTAGYYALVALTKGSKTQAARVRFIGQAGVRGNEPKESPPERVGELDSFADDGTSMTLEVPGAGDQEAKKVTIKIGAKATITYHNVGPGGATPTRGYSVQVWLEKGSKDTAAKVKFFRAVKDRYITVSGTVGALAEDGKSITLVAPIQGGKATVNLPIKLTDKTRLIFNGVKAGGDKITVGYPAQVALQKDSREIAARITFTGPKPPEAHENGLVQTRVTPVCELRFQS
jgi:hypothetical protein